MSDTKTHVGFLGVGSYAPERIVTNDDFAKTLDTSDEWIFSRTGIRERRFARDDEFTSDMGAAAARKALADAGLTVNDVDYVLVGTATPDNMFPSTAGWVTKLLGITDVGALDVSTACTGFIYVCEIASALIESGKYERILCIGADKLSTIANMKDRATCVLFGDAAGAALVQPCAEGDPGEILSVNVHADGRHGEILEFPAGGSRTPTTVDTAAAGLQYVHMKGQDVFKHAVRDMAACAQEALDAAGVTKDQVAWIIPHQANIRIVESVAKKMGFPMERVAVNLHKYGNTSAATIPTCFDEYEKAGRIRRGDLVLMTTFGGGLSWAGALIRW